MEWEFYHSILITPKNYIFKIKHHQHNSITLQIFKNRAIIEDKIAILIKAVTVSQLKTKTSQKIIVFLLINPLTFQLE